MLLRSLLAAFVLFVLPAATWADTLFTFRGPDFDPRESSGVYREDRRSHISGSFVTTTKIFPGMIFGPLNVTTFTVTDGYVTLTPSNAELSPYDFSISTDSQNRISGFIFNKQSTACHTIPDSSPDNCYSDSVIFISSLGKGPGYLDSAVDNSDTPFGEGENLALPGEPEGPVVITETTIQPAPEPSTLALLATGLLGVAGVLRKRSAAR